MVRIWIIVVSALVALIASQYVLHSFDSSKIKKLEDQNKKLVIGISKMKAISVSREDECKEKIKVIKVKHEIKNSVRNEMKENKSKGKNYEILATPSECGCKYDGTGWVFK